jgi:hypothetical protein
MLITLCIAVVDRGALDETLPNFIKESTQRKGEKKNNGQRPKSKQVNSPNEVGHKEERETLRIKTFMSGMKHIN